MSSSVMEVSLCPGGWFCSRTGGEWAPRTRREAERQGGWKEPSRPENIAQATLQAAISPESRSTSSPLFCVRPISFSLLAWSRWLQVSQCVLIS